MDGWVAAAETWTYVSADGPTGVFSVAADVTTKYSPGMRVRYTQTTVKYGIVTAVAAFAAGITSVTIYGGTDYTLANATISANSYATVKSPFGFPLDPAKWTETFIDSSDPNQTPPVTDTWYNLGTCALVLPIGVWDVEYEVTSYISITTDSVTTYITNQVTLSTANNSESDTRMTCNQTLRIPTVGFSVTTQTFYRRRTIARTSKATYYLSARTRTASVTALYFNGTAAPTIISAVCAYL